MAESSTGDAAAGSGDTPDSEAPRKPVRRRASRAAGPAAGEIGGAAEGVTATVDSVPRPAVPRPSLTVGPPPRRQPNRARLAAFAGAAATVVIVALASLVLVLSNQQSAADQEAVREQRFVDTATQTVVNMFTYTPDTVNDSVNRFIDGISGPLRDMMSQNDNVENLKSLFRDTNATSEAVVSGAALEAVDPDTDNGSVLVAVRVTVTDIDGINKPSQAYRMRVIVHEDANGRMTGYDLKYPDGGN
jgi:Mce-associated membrane protein